MGTRTFLGSAAWMLPANWQKDMVGVEVDPKSKLWHIHLRTRLTTIKLALQLLQRRSRLYQDPDGLTEKALQAVDAVARELEEQEGTPPTSKPRRAGA
jgi:hypothetical protein